MVKHVLALLCFLLMAPSLTLPTTITAQPDIIGPEDYPSGVNPLTGLPADDPATLDRRPLVVKITNFPPIVRPYQIGLNDAEIVWEHLLAGGVTRFTAVFLQSDLEKVGPIRSARLVDFQILRIYEGLFVYSGMAQGTLDVMFNDQWLIDHSIGASGPCPPLCRYPQEGLALEHTLFGNTTQLREDYAEERGANLRPAPVRGMAFSEVLPDGTPLASATVRYRQSIVGWAWDAEQSRWLRVQDGEPHWDNSTDTQVQAANVLILEAEHEEMPPADNEYWGPPNFAFDVPLVGSGRVYLLRDGALHTGEWRRANETEPLTFVDAAGDALPFAPGNTFVNLVPMWTDGYELELLPQSPQTVTVSGDTGVNMNYGPNPSYVSPDVAYPLDEFAVIGRNYNGDWLQVKRGDERAVWLPVARLSADDVDINALPNPRPSHER